ncbi:hypothetical protein PN498_17370 [Oscillatoria sp. CS-180]|uniref:hypothetical protein n=1 Tax=Oscillatoria sp. CS-180 TaxID=3021720 RepID=UPI00232D7ADE|nr:hypothetical protein [Oscillatoria sp. CS-180]MDB9527769.1 hypothetical protein [Oscillatoria sp. CS-180]
MRAILHRPHSALPRISEKSDWIETQQPISKRPFSVVLTLACDVMLLLTTVGAGLLLYALIVSVWPPAGSVVERDLVKWMPLSSIATSAAWYLFRDVLRCQQASSTLPFDYTEAIFQQIYWRRLEIILWAIASNLVLLCLCLLLPAQPFISKLFLSSVVALIALAVHKSIPTQRLAFSAATGVFSAAMFLIMMAGFLG